MRRTQGGQICPGGTCFIAYLINNKKTIGFCSTSLRKKHLQYMYDAMRTRKRFRLCQILLFFSPGSEILIAIYVGSKFRIKKILRFHDETARYLIYYRPQVIRDYNIHVRIVLYIDTMYINYSTIVNTTSMMSTCVGI